MHQLRIYQPWPSEITLPDAALKALGGVVRPIQVEVWIAATNAARAAQRLTEVFDTPCRRKSMRESFSEELVALLGSGRLLTPGEVFLTYGTRAGLGDPPVVEVFGPGRFLHVGHLRLSIDGRFVPVFIPGRVRS